MVNISHVLVYLSPLGGLLYNTSLPKGLEPTEGNESDLSWGVYSLPFLLFKVRFVRDSPAKMCICSGRWAQNALGDVWPSAETLAGLKKHADATTESFYKLQEQLLAKGADVTATFLEFPATKAVIKQTTTALGSLELEAHKSFCNCINDPRMKDLAIQFQDLNKQTSEALEYVKAHPTALDAKEKYNELSKRTAEAYAALIEQSPAARDAANTVQKAVEQIDTLCRDHPTLCSWVASGLVWAIFPSTILGSILPGTILGSIGFDKKGPRKGSLAAWAQSAVYGSTGVPGGSVFSVLQKWGMVGVPGELKATVVGGPAAALLLAQMKRDWSAEGCKALTKGIEEAAQL